MYNFLLWKNHTYFEYPIFLSDQNSEDEMAIFPPTKEKTVKMKQNLADTFSVEEFSEDGSEDSLHLGGNADGNTNTRTFTPTGCINCQCRIM